ncbi:PREDICTED: LEAF RUST 10 DISEASE-RESISTANCE LOCUS RECEPTOR-LIKE PROTEIN KINASE-like 2.1 isoform X2 [Ipomoea nil]|uniref:LEAF RUST 10 DISEASE-RESISTANCE LOCUS RECEPTOR-LIKE PROTEIN KINASE-like 2.1 isoform X2 n=1 Tax=Ipomoea nil TaxID=35883 RepID=UPI00090198CB|nr:PREDICTED: LEAF RUST 10 DISEASE-RESISTANCE LOCUS RECEPTOR-LIKE PROTEIN KINASE-like 2.1 isoform X2 [Ipomoea nil]
MGKAELKKDIVSWHFAYIKVMVGWLHIHTRLPFSFPVNCSLKMFPSSFILVFTIFFFFFFFLIKLNAADEDHIAVVFRENHCHPPSPCKKLGKLENIKYPFWRVDDNSSTVCGYPGFGIDCSNPHPEFPLLYLSDDAFLVKDINYDDYSVTLADADAFKKDCPRARHNFTLTQKSPWLYYGHKDLNLIFYFNCTQNPLPGGDAAYPPIHCLKSDRKASYLYVGAFNPYSWDWWRICEARVETTVMETVGVVENDIKWLVMNIGGAMSNGFNLNWQPLDDCSHCNPQGWCEQGKHNFGNFLCFCKNETVIIVPDCPSKAIGGAALCFVAFCIIKLFRYAYRRRQKRYSSGNELDLQGSFNHRGCIGGIFKQALQERKEYGNLEVFMEQYGSLAPVVYSYSDIKKMTNSFKHKLGQGGYGEVYKGNLHNGLHVAVKVLNSTKGNGEEFINEVVSICRTSHVNVVNLLGFCSHGTKRALVYEFMANGSLEKYIHENSTHLGWDKLYEIALGIAKGLEYLHKGCNTRIVHFDIKPHNILLDQDFCPKISDFGLAKLCANNKESIISMCGARGTIGYIAPEVVSRNFGSVSHKSDVYSYGMMVLEMVGGRKNVNDKVSHSSEIYFPHWAYQRLLLNENLKLQGFRADEEEEIAKKMILIGFWCIQTDPSDRPSMNKVIEMLVGSLEKLEMPPKPFLYSHSEDISQAISPIVPSPSFLSSSCTISMNID